MTKIRDYIDQADSAAEVMPEIPKPFPVSASNPKEEEKNTIINGTPSNEPDQFLISLLMAQPFWQFFEHLADRHFQGKSISLKVIKLKIAHPCLFHTCVTLDVVFRFIIFSGLVAAAFRALYKILS